MNNSLHFFLTYTHLHRVFLRGGGHVTGCFQESVLLPEGVRDLLLGAEFMRNSCTLET